MSKQLRGKGLLVARRLVEERRTHGKAMLKSDSRGGRPRTWRGWSWRWRRSSGIFC
jgi:hypothetical protein